MTTTDLSLLLSCLASHQDADLYDLHLKSWDISLAGDGTIDDSALTEFAKLAPNVGYFDIVDLTFPNSEVKRQIFDLELQLIAGSSSLDHLLHQYDLDQQMTWDALEALRQSPSKSEFMSRVTLDYFYWGDTWNSSQLAEWIGEVDHLEILSMTRQLGTVICVDPYPDTYEVVITNFETGMTLYSVNYGAGHHDEDYKIYSCHGFD